MQRLISILCGFCLVILSIPVLQASEWEASLANMPLSAVLDDEGSMTGAYVDLIIAIDKLAGTQTKINIYPFNRSLHNLVTGQANYHIPLIEIPNKSNDDLPYAFSTETLFEVAFVLYSNKEKPLDIRNLEKYQLATDSAHVDFFPFKITGISCLSCGIKMVNAGHLDGFIFAQNEIDPFIRELKLSNIHRQLYRYFNVKIVIPKGDKGKQIDTFFTKYIGELRETGKYDKLLSPVLFPYQSWQP